MSLDASTSPLAHVPSPAAAPLSGWRRMVADTLLVGGSTVVCQVMGAVNSLLLRWLLDPAQMGVWQGLKLLLSYGNYANLGISKGASQQFCIARGHGDLQEARRGLSLAHTVNMLSSTIYAAALFGAAAWLAWRGDGGMSRMWVLGLAVIGGLAIMQRYVTFQVTILRSRQDFKHTSRLAVLEAVLALAGCVTAVAMWGLPGLFLTTLMVLLGSLLFLRHCNPEPLAFAWDRREMTRLIGIGGPILLAGIASSLFRSIDKLMILGYLPDREYQLGCYSLALMVGAQLYGLANMVSTTMGPRYGELLGHSGDERRVARLAARSGEMQAALLALPAALALVVAEPILGRLLPDYRLGLPPLVWLVPGIVALGLALPASQFLIAVGRGKRVMWALLATTALAAMGNHWALTRGGGLVGVAAATMIADLAYLALLSCVSLCPLLSTGERLRFALVALLAVIGPVLLAAATSRLVPGSGWSSVLAQASMVAMAWAVLVGCGWHWCGWSKEWRGSKTA